MNPVEGRNPSFRNRSGARFLKWDDWASVLSQNTFGFRPENTRSITRSSIALQPFNKIAKTLHNHSLWRTAVVVGFVIPIDRYHGGA